MLIGALIHSDHNHARLDGHQILSIKIHTYNSIFIATAGAQRRGSTSAIAKRNTCTLLIIHRACPGLKCSPSSFSAVRNGFRSSCCPRRYRYTIAGPSDEIVTIRSESLTTGQSRRCRYTRQSSRAINPTEGHGGISAEQWQQESPTQPPPVPLPSSPSRDIQRSFSNPIFASFIAGGIAGAVSRTVVSPLERLKILFQIQTVGREEYKLGIGKALGKMWREEGFKGFMRGNGTNCVRIVPYSAVQFGSYNFYKRVSSTSHAQEKPAMGSMHVQWLEHEC